MGGSGKGRWWKRAAFLCVWPGGPLSAILKCCLLFIGREPHAATAFSIFFPLSMRIIPAIHVASVQPFHFNIPWPDQSMIYIFNEGSSSVTNLFGSFS
jgi:hypothetical protein